MDKQIEQLLREQIAEFKNATLKDALEDLGVFLAPANMRIVHSYAPYRVSIEVLKGNEPYFILTFFFRIYPVGASFSSSQIKLGITLSKRDVDVSGMEKRFPNLDRGITEITSADITNLVNDLVRSYRGE